MEEVFECFGVESEYHSDACAILRADQLQRVSNFPGVPEDGVTVTIDGAVALAREDMQYLSWEHPMLVSAMDLILSGNIGNAALSIIRHTGRSVSSRVSFFS
jgi:ATP-dependent helicase HepA